MTKQDIDQNYIDQHTALEWEFFDVVWEYAEGSTFVIGSHRVLKEDKTDIDFKARHTQLVKAHEAELITAGFAEPRLPSPPARNLMAEVDVLKEKVEALERK